MNVQKNSIVVLTGPNNAGKSSVLRAIDNFVSSGYVSGPVVRDIKIDAHGTAEQFKEFIESRSLKSQREGTVLIGRSELHPVPKTPS